MASPRLMSKLALQQEMEMENRASNVKLSARTSSRLAALTARIAQDDDDFSFPSSPRKSSLSSETHAARHEDTHDASLGSDSVFSSRVRPGYENEASLGADSVLSPKARPVYESEANLGADSVSTPRARPVYENEANLGADSMSSPRVRLFDDSETNLGANFVSQRGTTGSPTSGFSPNEHDSIISSEKPLSIPEQRPEMGDNLSGTLPETASTYKQEANISTNKVINVNNKARGNIEIKESSVSRREKVNGSINKHENTGLKTSTKPAVLTKQSSREKMTTTPTNSRVLTKQHSDEKIQVSQTSPRRRPVQNTEQKLPHTSPRRRPVSDADSKSDQVVNDRTPSSTPVASSRAQPTPRRKANNTAATDSTDTKTDTVKVSRVSPKRAERVRTGRESVSPQKELKSPTRSAASLSNARAEFQAVKSPTTATAANASVDTSPRKVTSPSPLPLADKGASAEFGRPQQQQSMTMGTSEQRSIEPPHSPSIKLDKSIDAYEVESKTPPPIITHNSTASVIASKDQHEASTSNKNALFSVTTGTNLQPLTANSTTTTGADNRPTSSGLGYRYSFNQSDAGADITDTGYQSKYSKPVSTPLKVTNNQQQPTSPFTMQESGVTLSNYREYSADYKTKGNIFASPCRSNSRTASEMDDDDSVGFSSLPEQVHRKALKRGFDFTLMVVGESGLGKSTLIQSLFLNTDLYNDRHILPVQERLNKTVQIEKRYMEIEERGVKLRLTIVDTPGYNDSLTAEDGWKPVENYIDQQFDQYFKDESGLNRKNIKDNRVHSCLYFISPFGHGLRMMDIHFMKRLHHKVNIVPVIAKADTLTKIEILKMKSHIMDQISNNEIHIYEFPDCDSDEDEEFKKQDSELKASIPFSVIGSNTIVEVNGKKIRGRLYPWGIVDVDSPEHCDFTKLRQMLISTHMQDLKDVTRDIHYENFRAKHITEEMSKQAARERNPPKSANEVPHLIDQRIKVVRSNSKLKRDSTPNFNSVVQTDALLKQKDEEIKKMQQMLLAMQHKLTNSPQRAAPQLNGGLKNL